MYRRRRLLGNPVIESYGKWNINVVADKGIVNNSGGTIIISTYASREVYWSNDEVTIEEGEVILSEPSIGDLQGNVLTIPANHSTSDISITINGTVNDVTKSFDIATQNKNIPTYIEYSGLTITSFGYSDKTAAAGSRNPSISYKMSRTQHWESSDDYVTPMDDVIVSSDDSYINYEESGTAGHSDATVYKQSGAVGWTANQTTTDRTTTVIATVTREGMTATKSAICKQLADVIVETIYADPVVTFNDYGSKDAAAGSIAVTLPKYSQLVTYVWKSGRETTQTLTSGGTITYSGSATGATVDTSTGTVTWTANTDETNDRSITVTTTVTINGKSGTDTATSTQLKDAYINTTWGAITIDTFKYDDVTAAGGSAKMTLNYTQVGTKNYISGATESTSQTVNIDDNYTNYEYVDYTGTEANGATIDKATGALIWTQYTNESADRTISIKATVNREGQSQTATTVAKQTKDAYQSTTWNTPVIETFSYSVKNANEGTITPTIKYTQTGTKNYISGKTGYTDSVSGSADDEYCSYSKGTNWNSAATLNTSTGAVTWTDNTSTTTQRETSVIITITRNDKTITDDAISVQSKDSLQDTVYGTPTITSVTATKDIPVTGGTTDASYFTIEYSQSKTLKYVSGDITSTLTGTCTSTMVTMTSNITGSHLHTTAKARTKLGTAKFKIEVNGVSSAEGSCDIYQAANTSSVTSYTYGAWTGTLSLNSTANLSASTDERTVTYGAVKRDKTEVLTWTTTETSNGNTTQEYYTGSVYVTTSVNTGSSYVTCAANYTNDDSTTTTKLTKSTYGTNVIASQTYTISLRLASTTGTVVQSITIKTTANAATTINYGTPVVSLSYSNVSACTKTQNPSLSYSQTRTQNYTSGDGTTAMSSLTSGGLVSYSETATHANATVASDTGVVTWDSTNGASSSVRTVGITATVTMNDKKGSSDPATAQQNADVVGRTDRGTPTISSFSYSNIAACTTTQSPSKSVSGTDTTYWSCASSTVKSTAAASLTYSYAFKTKGSATSVNASTGVITWPTNGATASARTCVVTLTVTNSNDTSKKATKDATAQQNGDTDGTVVRGTPTISSFSYSAIAACTTTKAPSISTSGTDTIYWSCASSTVRSQPAASLTYSYSETTAHSAASVNASNGTVTWSTNGASASSRSVGVTVTVTNSNDTSKRATKTATSTQNADTNGTVVRGTPTISSFSYSNIAACTTTQSPSKSASGTDTIYWSCASSTVRSQPAASLTYSYAFKTKGSATSVNSSTGVITWPTNGANASARTCVVTLTVTNSNDTSKKATKDATAQQNGDTNGTVVRGTPTISSFSYSAIAACTTTRSPSISASGTDTIYWSCASSTVRSQPAASLTYSYSETTAHSAASVNASNGTVTWSTNGASASSRSVGVTVTVSNSNDTSKKATKTATSTQNADTNGTVVRGTPTISSFSYSAIAACTTTRSPSISASGTDTIYWSCASSTVRSYPAASLTYSYAETTAHANATVNASNGTVTWSTNGASASSRSVGVTVTVTNSNDTSKKATKAATSVQNADTNGTVVRGTPTISSFSYSNIAACTTTQSPSKSVSGTDTIYWSCASSTVRSYPAASLTYSYAFKTKGSATSVNSSTGVITWPTNGATASARTCVVTLTVTNSNDTSKKATKDATAQQNGDTAGTTVYATPTITASYSQQGIYPSSYANGANVATLTKSATGTNTTYWSCASGTMKSSAAASFTWTYTKDNVSSNASDATVQSNGNVAFANANGGSDVRKSCQVTIRATNASDSTKTNAVVRTAYQASDGKSWRQKSFSATYPGVASYTATTVALYFNSTIAQYWNFAGTEVSGTAVRVTTPSGVTFSNVKITSGTSYATVNTTNATLSWKANNTTSTRTVTVTGKFKHGDAPTQSFTATATQNKCSLPYCTVTFTNTTSSVPIIIPKTGSNHADTSSLIISTKSPSTSKITLFGKTSTTTSVTLGTPYAGTNSSLKYTLSSSTVTVSTSGRTKSITIR